MLEEAGRDSPAARGLSDRWFSTLLSWPASLGGPPEKLRDARSALVQGRVASRWTVQRDHREQSLELHDDAVAEASGLDDDSLHEMFTSV